MKDALNENEYLENNIRMSRYKTAACDSSEQINLFEEISSCIKHKNTLKKRIKYYIAAIVALAFAAFAVVFNYFKMNITLFISVLLIISTFMVVAVTQMRTVLNKYKRVKSEIAQKEKRIIELG